MRRGFSGPPTSPPDPGPYSTHDHEFEPVEDAPIIEDGAAVFREECQWREVRGSYTSEKHDETFYDEGPKCGEHRMYRMEEAAVTKKRDDAPDITYIETDPDEWFWRIGEQAEIDAVTLGFDIESIDPDEEDGHVVIETEGWRIRYEA